MANQNVLYKSLMICCGLGYLSLVVNRLNFPLAEFGYNNNYHSSIHMEPFKALYGRHSHTPIGWFESTKPRSYGIDLL